MAENTNFMKNAFNALVERGIITREMLEESIVTDEMIEQFENEFELSVPQEFKDYLKAYCHSINAIGAAVPLDYIHDDLDVMHQINEMTPNEIVEMDEDEAPYVEEVWSGIMPVPKDDPLGKLREAVLGLKAFADCVKNDEVTEASVKRFLPVAEWMDAGPLCIDTEKKKEDVDIDNPDTWQLRWFDHEEFDWIREGYIDDEGRVVGRPLFPDFETFVKLYFYGVYDKEFYRQNETEGEEQPDKSKWYEAL